LIKPNKTFVFAYVDLEIQPGTNYISWKTAFCRNLWKQQWAKIL